MSSPLVPPKKRRRAEAPSTTLSRPFKTPLKSASRSTNVGNSSPFTRTPILKEKSVSIQSVSPTYTPLNALSPMLPPLHARPQLYTSPSTVSPRVAELQKQSVTLLTQLKSLKGTLDIHKQALKIESSTSDAHLQLLIDKWRRASRDAAEEVYRDSKNRIDGMGGTRAWKAHERERAVEGAFGGVWNVGQGKRLWEDEDRIDSEPRETSEKHEAVEETVDDDESFTIDMMLKTLNIPPNVIGFDQISHNWVD